MSWDLAIWDAADALPGESADRTFERLQGLPLSNEDLREFVEVLAESLEDETWAVDPEVCFEGNTLVLNLTFSSYEALEEIVERAKRRGLSAFDLQGGTLIE